MKKWMNRIQKMQQASKVNQKRKLTDIGNKLVFTSGERKVRNGNIEMGG